MGGGGTHAVSVKDIQVSSSQAALHTTCMGPEPLHHHTTTVGARHTSLSPAPLRFAPLLKRPSPY
eukprot:scaffold65719_cov65-Phaeocystis_antarctica.AAC.7